MVEKMLKCVKKPARIQFLTVSDQNLAESRKKIFTPCDPTCDTCPPRPARPKAGFGCSKSSSDPPSTPYGGFWGQHTVTRTVQTVL